MEDSIRFVAVLILVYMVIWHVVSAYRRLMQLKHIQELRRVDAHEQELKIKEKELDLGFYLDEKKFEVWKTATLAHTSTHGKEAAQYIRGSGIAPPPRHGHLVPIEGRPHPIRHVPDDDDPEDPKTH